ncbi:MAG: Beta-hexosaminidase [Pseudomonadota bacterium]
MKPSSLSSHRQPVAKSSLLGQGPVWIDLDGPTLLPLEKTLLQHPAVGGLVLFTRNFEHPDQLRALVQNIRAIAPNLILAVDHEGGRVWRFREGFSHIPAMRTVGQLFDRNVKKSLQTAEHIGWLIASELLAYGIDLSFAPVLDIDNHISAVIGDRSFHADPKSVATLGKALIKGMRAAGMRAVGKHFPGHGGCAPDSHTSTAIDTRRFEEILANDLVPFATLSSQLSGIMTAHVVYQHVDPVPASYSNYWLKDILRTQLGFKGAIFSDCLSMTAASIYPDLSDRIIHALSAGCDIAILCQQTRETLLAVLNKLPQNIGITTASKRRRRSLRANFEKKSWEKPKPKVNVFA